MAQWEEANEISAKSKKKNKQQMKTKWLKIKFCYLVHSYITIGK